MCPASQMTSHTIRMGHAGGHDGAGAPVMFSVSSDCRVCPVSLSARRGQV